MATIAFRANESLKKKLEHLAQYKGINTSALIKMYLTKSLKQDLNEKTENGITVPLISYRCSFALSATSTIFALGFL